MMWVLINKCIPEGNRQTITDLTPSMPLRDEFLFSMDPSGKVTLEWWKFSMYKLHQLLTIIVDNTKTSTDLMFVSPLEEAVKEGKTFLEAFDAVHLKDVAMDPLTIVRIQQEAKKKFNTSYPRMHEYLQDVTRQHITT